MSREGGTPSEEEPDELAEFRAELDEVERSVIRGIDPGAKSMVIAFAALALLIAAVLPWIGGYGGWQVLLGQTDPSAKVGVLPRVFVGLSLVFGVFASALTLAVRRWGLAWMCALGCWLTLVNGMLAIWTRQTSNTGMGPGIGMIVAVLAIFVLAVTWFRIAWSRPS